MAKIYKSVEELIGNTPLLELTKIEKGTGATLLAKVEALNPGGSAKDRIAKRMVEDAEKAGILKEGATIIEPTSGNTGIGLALMAAARGYRAIIVMPDSMSMERRLLMTAFGAELVLTEGKQGMKGAVEKAEELAKEIPNSFIAGQFVNPSNPAAHYETTGPEIWADTDGKVDIFVAGIGTGGTITGVGKYLKEKNPAVQIVAVEPAASPLLSKGVAGPHGIQGIGANFVPDVLNTDIYEALRERKVCCPVFPQVRRYMRRRRLQSAPKMQAKTLWYSCRIRATDISPLLCSRNNGKGTAAIHTVYCGTDHAD